MLLLLLLLLLLDVVPDIVTIGKPMGNGFPVSGVVTTPTVDTLHAKKAPLHYSSVSGVCTYLCLCTLKYYNNSGVEAEKSALELNMRTSVHEYCYVCASLCIQFGGNAVSMAAAEAVLCIIEDERLQENATEVGEHLMQRAKELMAKYPQFVGDVR